MRRQSGVTESAEGEGGMEAHYLLWEGQHYLLCSEVILRWKSENFVPWVFCQSH